jgi:hypothetical protein
MNNDSLITEDWLRDCGFKWSQFDRQPNKQWLLWLGGALGDSWTGPEDLGLELANGAYNHKTKEHDHWFCWLRSDSSHRYHRFIHVRHIQTQAELISMIEGLTGQKWDPANNWYGCMRTPEHAAHLREVLERLDRRIQRESPKWYESEKDETRAGPDRRDMEAAIETGKAK